MMLEHLGEAEAAAAIMAAVEAGSRHASRAHRATWAAAPIRVACGKAIAAALG